MSAANEASYAARPRTEQRSAVGAQGRPPQLSGLLGTACRDPWWSTLLYSSPRSSAQSPIRISIAGCASTPRTRLQVPSTPPSRSDEPSLQYGSRLCHRILLRASFVLAQSSTGAVP